MNNNTRLNHTRTGLRLSAALFISLLILLTSPAQATKLYKWVDDDGRVSYQDRPPPERAKILEERELSEESASNSSGNTRTFVGDPVIVYVVENCERCSQVIQRLKEMGVSTNERQLKDYRDVQSDIIRTSGSLTAPTLYINEKYILDSSTENIERVLADAGYISDTAEDEPAQDSNDEEESDKSSKYE